MIKNLLIFFDNQAFKINNIIINYIKRWILYKIIYNINQYNNINIYKTYPEPNEKNIKVSNLEDIIDDTLIYLNNVIYKENDDYATICFKNIIDKIDNIESVSEIDNNEILIVTSLKNNTFTENNIKYINEKIDSFKSKINLMNISSVEIFKNLVPKLNEITIDINCLKTENIPIEKFFEFEEINNLEQIKKYENIDIKSLSKLEYLGLIYNIEKMILSNILYNKKLDIKQNKLIVHILNNMNIIGIENFCEQLKNIFKSYKNTVRDIFNRHHNLTLNLPIDKLTPELSNSYIKYILEFYSIIYPKINYYKSLSISGNSQKNKQKNLYESTSEIKIKNVKNIDIEQNNISCQYLTSSLTITNWKDEYDNANPFGFLIKYHPTKLSYKGIFDLNSSILKTYPNMMINNITTNFVPLYDYYQIILFDYEKDENDENDETNENNDHKNSEKKTFNISQFCINDNINGDGNVLLPIYINKNHWELSKSIWSYHMSFINNCFEQEYNIKMDNIYFFVILKFLNNLKNNKNNIKITIRLFGYILRTCIQILVDNKFIHSVKNDYKKYLELILNLELLDKNSMFSDFVIRIIQLIISNSIDVNELEIDLNKITMSIFKKYIISNFKMDFWDNINNENISNEQKKNELDILKNQVIQENICWLYLDFDLKLLNKIIKSIYLLNGFNQFVKQIDKTHGCFEDIEQDDKSISLGTIKDIIDSKCSEQFDMTYYYQFIDISKYCEIQI